MSIVRLTNPTEKPVVTLVVHYGKWSDFEIVPNDANQWNLLRDGIAFLMLEENWEYAPGKPYRVALAADWYGRMPDGRFVAIFLDEGESPTVRPEKQTYELHRVKDSHPGVVWKKGSGSLPDEVYDPISEFMLNGEYR